MNWFLIVVEFDMVLIAMFWLVVFQRNRPFSASFDGLQKRIAEIESHQTFAIFLIGAVVLCARVALLPVIGIPHPAVHDEFSHLLAADTFAHGRLTNSTHPMWQHFETFHVIHQPTYMSMYPPAQGLVLAFGQILGHPWIGVLFSTAAMCSALCWALQGWLPPKWAFLGAALAVIRIGIPSYWMNSYWGGSVSALGGALVFGAVPRLQRKPCWNAAVLMGVGLAILANSRPYEGLLFSVPLMLPLLLRISSGHSHKKWPLPFLAVLAIAAAGTGYFYHRVTGNAFRMTYQVNRDRYAMAKYFLWQKPNLNVIYHHPVMRGFYDLELETYRQNITLKGFLRRSYEKLLPCWDLYLGPSLTFPLIFFPVVWRQRRMLLPLTTATIFAVGISFETWTSPHYLAPATALILLIVVQCVRHLSDLEIRGRRYGLLIFELIIAMCIFSFFFRLTLMGIQLNSEAVHLSFGYSRATVLRSLNSEAGNHLVIIRYNPGHNLLNEWVYNDADIDAAKVVWARDMGAQNNAELVRYFSQRRVWIMNPDASPVRPMPYVTVSDSEVVRDPKLTAVATSPINNMISGNIK